ncbi:hypothetical protein J6590_090333 [Homalodisca vitripennis]|nr:hypothetical protein J6590_090333 [Homalodisca vitripennis]
MVNPSHPHSCVLPLSGDRTRLMADTSLTYSANSIRPTGPISCCVTLCTRLTTKQIIGIIDFIRCEGKGQQEEDEEQENKCIIFISIPQCLKPRFYGWKCLGDERHPDSHRLVIQDRVNVVSSYRSPPPGSSYVIVIDMYLLIL